MNPMRMMKRTLLAAGLLLAALPAMAGGVDDFHLLKAVPADTFMVSSSRSHAGQEWLNKQYAKVWAEVEKARIDREIKRMVKGAAKESGVSDEDFDAQWQKVVDLANAIDFSSLAGRESAFGMRIAMPMPEMVALFMPPADKVKSNFDGLAGVLKTLAEMAKDEISLTTEEKDGGVVHVLSPKQSPFPIALTLALHKDVILVGLGSSMPEQSLALLQGKAGESVAKSERFQAAFKKLPAPTDELQFVDFSKLMGQLRELVSAAMGMMPTPPPDSPEYAKVEKVQKLPGKLLDMWDMWEYSATVATTEGMKRTEESATLLRKDAKSHAMYPVYYGNPPLDEPLKYVPKQATDFRVHTGFDVGALWSVVKKVMKEDIPDSEEFFTELESMKTEHGLDIEKDVIGLFQGGAISLSAPGATVNSGEWTVMLRLKDEAHAKEMLKKVVDQASAAMKSEAGDGQATPSASIQDASIEGVEGFKSLAIPQLAMVMPGKPTFGIKDGWLFLASGSSAVTSVLNTASGKADSVAKNERFLKEGLPVGKNVRSLSFSDDTKFGEQMSQLLTMVPMINMFAPDVAKNPAASGLINMIGKMGRVVRKLDFYLSSAAQTTMDGEWVLSKKISNFREPPAPKTPESATPESENKPQ